MIIVSTPPFTTLSDDLTGRLLLPADTDFARVATPWNVAVPVTAAAVVEAATAEDVVAAVRFAAAHGLRVGVQATGHGAVPAQPDADPRPLLLVHTGLLDELTIDPLGSARIGAGVRWDAVLQAAAPLGLGPLAGSAPGVGVVGYLTGGGLGPVARTYGVASDRVTAFDVVTGDGVLRRASADENQALFWGLRGGKGALGIVTAVETELVAIREIFGGALYFAGADAAAVLHAWREWTPTLPDQATSSVAIVRLPDAPGVPVPLAGKVSVAVRFAWVGDPEQGRRSVAPMLTAAEPVLGGFDVMPYAALGAIHQDPVDPVPAQEQSALLSALTADAVDAIVERAGSAADCPQIVVELRHLGGAIRRESSASAFGHRDPAYALLVIGISVPPVHEMTRAHASDLLAAVAPVSTGTSLPNFGATSDPAAVSKKYPRDTLLRLASLADTYDPHGVIAGAAAIRAAVR